MLQAWSNVLKVERNLNGLDYWINEETLFHNQFIQTRHLSSVNIRRTLVKNGVTKLIEIFAILPSSYRKLVAGRNVQHLKEEVFPKLKIIPAVSGTRKIICWLFIVFQNSAAGGA